MKTAARRGVSSPQQVPPWLQEHIQQLQQAQQNLNMILMQKQQLDSERVEIEKALDELRASDESRPVYKHAGMILVRSTRSTLLDEIEERKTLNATRAQVLTKQEERLRAAVKEKEVQIQSMIQRGPAAAPPGAGGGMAPPPPPAQQPGAR